MKPQTQLAIPRFLVLRLVKSMQQKMHLTLRNLHLCTKNETLIAIVSWKPEKFLCLRYTADWERADEIFQMLQTIQEKTTIQMKTGSSNPKITTTSRSPRPIKTQR